MRSIYKYDIIEAEDGVIEGPITKLLHIGVQHNSIKLWAEIDTNAPTRKFQIIPIGTGWPLDAPAGKECILDTHTYIGTIQMAGGSLVFHVYGAEILPTPVKDKKPESGNAQKTKPKSNPNKEASFTITNHVIDPEVLQKFLG